MKTGKLYDKHTIEGTEIMPFNNFQAAITEYRQSIVNEVKEMEYPDSESSDPEFYFHTKGWNDAVTKLLSLLEGGSE